MIHVATGKARVIQKLNKNPRLFSVMFSRSCRQHAVMEVVDSFHTCCIRELGEQALRKVEENQDIKEQPSTSSVECLF